MLVEGQRENVNEKGQWHEERAGGNGDANGR